MTSLLKALVVLSVTVAFAWLAVYAWRTHPPRPMSLGEFAAWKVAEYEP